MCLKLFSQTLQVKLILNILLLKFILRIYRYKVLWRLTLQFFVLSEGRRYKYHDPQSVKIWLNPIKSKK